MVKTIIIYDHLQKVTKGRRMTYGNWELGVGPATYAKPPIKSHQNLIIYRKV